MALADGSKAGEAKCTAAFAQHSDTGEVLSNMHGCHKSCNY